MKNDLKSRFDGLFARHQLQMKKRQETETPREGLAAADTVIDPAILEVLITLEQNGWQAQVEKSDTGLSVKMDIFQGHTLTSGTDLMSASMPINTKTPSQCISRPKPVQKPRSRGRTSTR